MPRTTAPRPALVRRAASADAGGSGEHDRPPRMPPFPHPGEKGGLAHGLRFLAEVFWWGLTVVWILFSRLPRWARLILMVWFVFTIMGISNCRMGSAARKKVSEDNADEIRTAVEEALKAASKVSEAAKGGDSTGKPGDRLPDYA